MRFLRTSLLVGCTTILLALGVAAQIPSPQPPGLPSELIAKLAKIARCRARERLRMAASRAFDRKHRAAARRITASRGRGELCGR